MRLRPDTLGPSTEKRYGKHKKKAPTTPLPEDKETGSATMFPPYIPPKSDDAPNIIILKNARCPLAAPIIPKRVWVTQSILTNLKKMTFVDHDL